MTEEKVFFGYRQVTSTEKKRLVAVIHLGIKPGRPAHRQPHEESRT